MINKLTASLPVIWDCDNDNQPLAKQISTGGREIVEMKLVASNSAATIFLYDTNEGKDTPANLAWVLDSSSQNNDHDTFAGPLTFKKGIYAVLTQGANSRPILCMAVIPTDVR